MTTDKKDDNGMSQVISTRVATAEPTAPEKLSLGKKILYHLWDADQHLKSPEERALVRKLDFGILICATLGWWMKYIDQSNIANAYVSGMKEDLHIQGNEYTYMLMCYTIAFAIMQIPSNMITLKVRPRIFLVICELGWTVFTFAQAAATSSNQMYAFRFMVGFFESGFSPVIIFLLGSWYNKAELAKRVAIWHITGFFGSATSGFLQAGIHASLDGHLGLAGWRWLYIKDDKRLAMQRSAKQGKANITGVMDLKLAKRMLGSWRWWVLCIMYIFYGNSCQANQYFSVYLRNAGYSVSLRNIIPACANLVTMATDFLWGFMSDLTGNRAYWIAGPLVFTTVIGSTILTVWPEADTPKVAAFFLTASGYVTAVTWTWSNEINNGNAEERALTISSMNGLFYATNSFLPILIFPQTMAPTFEYGFPSILAFALCAIVLVLFTEFMHKRQLRQEAEAAASLPSAETAQEEKRSESDVDNKVAGAVEAVKGSAAIM